MVIVNPFSGTKSKAKVPMLIDELIDKSRFEIEIAIVERENHVHDLSTQAIEGGYYGVIAVGGDGTINGAASALRDSDVALGIVPCGSGNGLARHLGIPLNVKKALSIINADKVEALDYCMLNDTPFVCTCGMGFDAVVADSFAHKSRRGPITYVRTAITEYLTFKPTHYRIEIDGKELEVDAFVVACANAAQYGNNAFISPHASMQDGLLDVVVMTPFHRLESPIMGLDLFTKRLDKNTHVSIYRTRRVVIHRPEPAVMHVDGEPLMMPADLTVTCHPAGIKMFIP